MNTASIHDSFLRINLWLSEHAPKILKSLQNPAPEEQFKILSDVAARALPSEFYDLYRTHNGISPEAMCNLFFGVKFISIEDSINQVKDIDDLENSPSLKYVDPGIRNNYTFNKSRVPIGDDSGTCLICVDLEPDEGGFFGQVILIDYDYSIAIKLANSLSQFVSNFAADLESGKYSLQEDALADGKEWLEPSREIDSVNWFNSPTWRHIKI
ncbi:MAG: SMI1/KNR4 family protein [Pseudomonas sp.]|nr:SMI1/KNR4 family protein [Pseudomonas sp.]